MIQRDLCTFCQASQEAVKHFLFFFSVFIHFGVVLKTRSITRSVAQREKKLEYESIILGPDIGREI